MQTNAILLLAYGGPNSLDDIPAYVSNIRGGRPVPPQVLEEITRRYRLIGGRSPLLDITRRIAARLQDEVGMPVYVGMRHWYPYIADTVSQMARDGITRAVAICLAPHYSALSVGAYRMKLEETLAKWGTDFRVRKGGLESPPLRAPSENHGMSVDFIESWHTQPHYLAGIAANVQETLARFPSNARVKIIFTAHSLPASIVQKGDPYDAQLRETARLLAQELNLTDERWTLCYQSASRSNMPWLGPQIEELVPQLAQAGERDLLIAPIGLITDHAEVLYDLDIGVQEIARAHNLRVERTPMLNDSPALVAALAELVRERMR